MEKELPYIGLLLAAFLLIAIAITVKFIFRKAVGRRTMREIQVILAAGYVSIFIEAFIMFLNDA